MLDEKIISVYMFVGVCVCSLFCYTVQCIPLVLQSSEFVAWL